MSTVSVLAVSMTIGTPDSVRIARQTSMPFMPGSMRSSSTTSGRSSRTAGSARVPSPTTAVSKPSPRSTMVSISASAGVVVDDEYARLHGSKHLIQWSRAF